MNKESLKPKRAFSGLSGPELVEFLQDRSWFIERVDFEREMTEQELDDHLLTIGKLESEIALLERTIKELKEQQKDFRVTLRDFESVLYKDENDELFGVELGSGNCLAVEQDGVLFFVEIINGEPILRKSRELTEKDHEKRNESRQLRFDGPTELKRVLDNLKEAI